MKGKIITFKTEQGFGFIKGEDNKNYFFHISKVLNPMDIKSNYVVDFNIKETTKGLNAININIHTPLSQIKSKDKLLKIKDLRLRASEIKEYNIITEINDGDVPDENGYYHFHIDFSKELVYEYLSTDTHTRITYESKFRVNAPFIEKKEYICDTYNIQIEYRDNLDGWFKIRSQNNGNLNNVEAWKNSKELWRKCNFSSLIRYKPYKRKCYSILIITYNSGNKFIDFFSHNEEKNRLEAKKWIDYIDKELEPLI